MLPLSPSLDHYTISLQNYDRGTKASGDCGELDKGWLTANFDREKRDFVLLIDMLAMLVEGAEQNVIILAPHLLDVLICRPCKQSLNGLRRHRVLLPIKARVLEQFSFRLPRHPHRKAFKGVEKRTGILDCCRDSYRSTNESHQLIDCSI